jgi:prevent-host-death family protein
MQKTISATQARIHFGDIMKQAKVAPVFVERSGKAEVVVLSKKAYDRLVAANQQTDWQAKLEDLHKRIKTELAGRTLPAPEEMLRLAREERDEQLINSLR